MIIHPAPGYVLGRQAKADESRSPGGIILPAGSLRHPVIRIVADGGPRQHGDRTFIPFPEPELNTEFKIQAGVQAIIAGAEQMIDLGYDQLWIVPYEAIVAVVEERDAW
jgi:hypothetical protein